MLGEYNIGGDAFVIEDLFERCGITLVSTFSGNASYEDMANSPQADLNLVMCHRSINYMAEMMETKYGIPWIKVNFIGADGHGQVAAQDGQVFRRPGADRPDRGGDRRGDGQDRPGAGGGPRRAARASWRCCSSAARRAHHYQDLFTDIGMKTISAGYEFAHRDDYEGRKVLPTIKVDADSRNIEEIDVEADPVALPPPQDRGREGTDGRGGRSTRQLRRDDAARWRRARW